MSRFNSNAEDAVRVLSTAGMSIRRKLKRIYGTPEAAEKALRERAADLYYLENWATIQTGEPFTFEDLPPSLREKAVLSMAGAMLVWDDEQAYG